MLPALWLDVFKVAAQSPEQAFINHIRPPLIAIGFDNFIDLFNACHRIVVPPPRRFLAQAAPYLLVMVNAHPSEVVLIGNISFIDFGDMIHSATSKGRG